MKKVLTIILLIFISIINTYAQKGDSVSPTVATDPFLRTRVDSLRMLFRKDNILQEKIKSLKKLRVLDLSNPQKGLYVKYLYKNPEDLYGITEDINETIAEQSAKTEDMNRGMFRILITKKPGQNNFNITVHFVAYNLAKNSRDSSISNIKIRASSIKWRSEFLLNMFEDNPIYNYLFYIEDANIRKCTIYTLFDIPTPYISTNATIKGRKKLFLEGLGKYEMFQDAVRELLQKYNSYISAGEYASFYIYKGAAINLCESKDVKDLLEMLDAIDVLVKLNNYTSPDYTL